MHCNSCKDKLLGALSCAFFVQFRPVNLTKVSTLEEFVWIESPCKEKQDDLIKIEF